MGRARNPSIKMPPKVLRKETCTHCGNRYEVINGAWLRWMREKAGIDQRSFAKMLGYSGPYLSDIERNRRACPADIFEAYKNL